MTQMHLRRQSRELFPSWSRSMRAKWVLARLAAPGMKPLYRMKHRLDAHHGRGDEQQRKAA